MLNLKKIAVTGGLASGKSTVCRLLSEKGAYQVNSDTLIHQLLSDNPSCIKQVVALLGARILVDERIDRSQVAKIVFADKAKLAALEAIVHPLLFEAIDRLYQQAKTSQTATYFVVEMPLVQEIGKTSAFDAIVAVLCSEAISKKRWAAAGFPEKSYEERMQRHWPIQKKAAHAHFTITNNGTYEDLKRHTAALIGQLNRHL